MINEREFKTNDAPEHLGINEAFAWASGANFAWQARGELEAKKLERAVLEARIDERHNYTVSNAEQFMDRVAELNKQLAELGE